MEREILWRRLESLANLGIGEGRGPLFVFKYRRPPGGAKALGSGPQKLPSCT